MTAMRLQRALARAGVASRRRAEDLIRAGRVRVNGAPAVVGQVVDPDTDAVTVDGRAVRPAPIVWMALNKPVGYLVSRRGSRGRQTVFALVPSVPGLTYVGRLDVMTSGLLLLTTDGKAAHRLMHPRYAVERTYRAVVHGRSRAAVERAFSRDIVIDGRPVAIRRMALSAGRGRTLELTLVLAEGRYRIVRRVCGRVGLTVERLVRLRYGPVRLGRLPVGRWRYLTAREQHALRAGRAASRKGSWISAARRF